MKSGVDYEELLAFSKKLKEFENNGMGDFMEIAAKDISARLLRKMIYNTPVGEYDKEVNFTTKDGKEVSFTPHTGKKGGTLRRGWTAEKPAFLKKNNDVIISIKNPVEYASYVEYGHRTKDGKCWVEGRFMMTKAEEKMSRQAPAILEKKIKEFLEERLNDR